MNFLRTVAACHVAELFAKVKAQRHVLGPAASFPVIFPKANQRTSLSGLSRQRRRREILTHCDYVANGESRIEHRVKLLSEKAIL